MRSVFYSHLVNGPFGDPALYLRIAHRGEALLFDCGELHALTTRELLKLRAVFISHAHIDHLIGFDHLLRTFLYQDRELLLCGPPGFIDQVAARLAGYSWNLISGYPLVLVVREWGRSGLRQARFRADNRFRPEGEVELEGDPSVLLSTPEWAVRTVPLAHGDLVSLAFALEEPEHIAIHKDALDAYGYRPGPWLTEFKSRLRQGESGQRQLEVPMVDGSSVRLDAETLEQRIAHRERGMKVVYVTDAAPTPSNRRAIVDLARDAHLLVIEAPFAHADLERARQRHHLTARLAGELGRAAGAARLLVFHHSPRYEQAPDRLREEAVVAFEGGTSSQ